MVNPKKGLCKRKPKEPVKFETKLKEKRAEVHITGTAEAQRKHTARKPAESI